MVPAGPANPFAGYCIGEVRLRTSPTLAAFLKNWPTTRRRLLYDRVLSQSLITETNLSAPTLAHRDTAILSFAQPSKTGKVPILTGASSKNVALCFSFASIKADKFPYRGDSINRLTYELLRFNVFFVAFEPV